MLGSVPCLTLLAGYPVEGPRPDWQLCYPDSRVLQLVSHDSSKRLQPRWTTLVLQAQVGWSQRQLAAGVVDGWSAELLHEAGRVVGAWAETPTWTHPHRWRFARADRGTELASPLLLGLDGGAQLGLAGESFAPGGGVEAAYLSGERLAGRLLESGRF